MWVCPPPLTPQGQQPPGQQPGARPWYCSACASCFGKEEVKSSTLLTVRSFEHVKCLVFYHAMPLLRHDVTTVHSHPSHRFSASSSVCRWWAISWWRMGQSSATSNMEISSRMFSSLVSDAKTFSAKARILSSVSVRHDKV